MSYISNISGKTSDTTSQVPRINPQTHSLNIIDYAHHEIHTGSHYFFYDYDSDVDTGAPKYYRLTTPDTTKWPHITFDLYSEGFGLWQLFENPTVNAAGTAGVIFNNDRNSTNVPTLSVRIDPTSTADGTLLAMWRTGSSSGGGNRSPAVSRNETEIILKQNEDYFFKFTADADNSRTKIGLSWYEHTNRTA